jgi:hypothetical protein
VATPAARNAILAVMARMMGSGGVCIWRNSGVWSQAVDFMLLRLAGIWLQPSLICFHILFTRSKFYEFCTSVSFAKIMLQ